MAVRTKPFAELAGRINADPTRRARVDQYKQAIADALSLGQLRSERGMTQQAVARVLGQSQANVSRIERTDDVYLSTLQQYIGALGGHLEINAVFPDQKICVELSPQAAD